MGNLRGQAVGISRSGPRGSHGRVKVAVSAPRCKWCSCVPGKLQQSKIGSGPTGTQALACCHQLWGMGDKLSHRGLTSVKPALLAIVPGSASCMFLGFWPLKPCLWCCPQSLPGIRGCFSRQSLGDPALTGGCSTVTETTNSGYREKGTGPEDLVP